LMFDAFNTALEPSQFLIGPKMFRMVMHKFGVADTILVKRLFETFAEHTARLDYRELLRSFIAVSGAPADQKLDLLFDIYNEDELNGGNWSLTLVTLIIAKMKQGVVGAGQRLDALGRPTAAPPIDLRAALDEDLLWEIEKIYAAARAFILDANLGSPDEHEEDHYIARAPAGTAMTKETVLVACRENATIRDFFDVHLACAPVKAKEGDDENRLRNFYHRLNELEGEVFRSVNAPPSEPPSPPTKPAFKFPPALNRRLGLPPSPNAKPLPLHISRGSKSAAATWTAAALVRRKQGTHARTENSMKQAFTTNLNSKLPRARSEYKFTEDVDPKVLNAYLNNSRRTLGLPLHESGVEHLVSSRRLRRSETAA